MSKELLMHWATPQTGNGSRAPSAAVGRQNVWTKEVASRNSLIGYSSVLVLFGHV